MPTDQEREELALLLLGLTSREWLTFFIDAEREVAQRYQALLRRIEAIEARAVERYRSQVSQFPVRGGLLRSGSRARIVTLERAMEGVFIPPMKANGQVGQRVVRDMRQLTAKASEKARAHAASTRAIFEGFGAEDFSELEQEPVQLSSASAWAARRDLEVMADRAAHKAALQAFAAIDADMLQALREAPRAVKIPRSSTRNSIQGSAREAIRSAVYRSSGPVARWLAVRPYREAPKSMVPLPESEWVKRAAKVARGNWRPGNPVSGYGLHVGSRTYFAPVVSAKDMLLVAGSALLFVPDYLEHVLRVSPQPFYERRGEPVFRIGGRRMDTLEDFSDSVARALAPQIDRAGPLPVPVREMRSQARVEAIVRARFEGENSGQRFVTLSIDKGRRQGVEMHMVFRITSPLPPPVIRGQATVIALYPDFATLLFEFGPRTNAPRLFDYASTLGSDA